MTGDLPGKGNSKWGLQIHSLNCVIQLIQVSNIFNVFFENNWKLTAEKIIELYLIHS